MWRGIKCQRNLYCVRLVRDRCQKTCDRARCLDPESQSSTRCDHFETGNLIEATATHGPRRTANARSAHKANTAKEAVCRR